MDAPCKTCFFREPGCHGGCAQYKKFKEELKAINAARRKINGSNTIAYGYTHSQISKAKHAASRRSKV